METINEQRKFKRVNFLQSVVAKADEETYSTQCFDISLRGILLARPNHTEHWQPAKKIKARLVLSPEHSIEMNAKIVHLTQEVVGLECETLDIDSLTVLRRLLELNLANPEEVNRELAELSHLH